MRRRGGTRPGVASGGGEGSPADERGLLLGEEGLHADAGVLGGEDGGELLGFDGESLVEGQLVPLGDGPLHRGVRPGRPGGEAPGVGEGEVEDLLGGRDFVGEADGEGLVGGDVASAHAQLLGPLEADDAGEALRAAGAGDDAETDLRLSDLGVVGEVAEVGAHRQLEAAAEGVAADGGDGGFGEALQGVDDGDEPGGLPLLGPPFEGGLEAGDVGSGGEVGRAGDDDGPDRVGGGLLEGGPDVGDELGVERVDRGSVQRDDGDGILYGVLDQTHGPSSTTVAPRLLRRRGPGFLEEGEERVAEGRVGAAVDGVVGAGDGAEHDLGVGGGERLPHRGRHERVAGGVGAEEEGGDGEGAHHLGELPGAGGDDAFGDVGAGAQQRPDLVDDVLGMPVGVLGGERGAGDGAAEGGEELLEGDGGVAGGEGGVLEDEPTGEVGGGRHAGEGDGSAEGVAEEEVPGTGEGEDVVAEGADFSGGNRFSLRTHRFL